MGRDESIGSRSLLLPNKWHQYKPHPLTVCMMIVTAKFWYCQMSFHVKIIKYFACQHLWHLWYVYSILGIITGIIAWSHTGFHLENCPRGGGGGGGGATGGIWILKGGWKAWWLKKWQSFTNVIGRVGVCLNVCAGFYIGFWVLGGGGKLQSSVLTWRGCIVHYNKGGLGACSPRIFQKLMLEIDSGGTSSQFQKGSPGYTARFSFIWIVKESGGGGGGDKLVVGVRGNPRASP